MAIPQFTAKTDEALRAERDEVVAQMQPYTVDMLKRLRDATAIEFEEENLLDRYEALTWVLGEG
ncbi:hypothetical protein CCICO_08010 [Corynebacterium ciconiae DSM 44920]|uniref:hypothetical protein n=1 Tax=Corynebacterium ciconiae TaxID=227319 RepID=UPI00036BA3F9|nr:hypothetical protein [Corynebacterium ciconiae]WKD61618.1 hypothetical protein CCICO_08010 [Corynebacterium ciconiae DSM 44920]